MNPVPKPSAAPAIKSKPEYVVIGVKERHAFQPEGPMPTIAEQWQRFMQRIQEIPERSPAAPALGICISFDFQTQSLDYIAGIVVESKDTPVPAGMVLATLEPQTYAIFTHRGPIARMCVTHAAIQQWLADQSEYTRAPAPEFEYYDHRYISNESEDSELDIYVPVIRN